MNALQTLFKMASEEIDERLQEQYRKNIERLMRNGDSDEDQYDSEEEAEQVEALEGDDLELYNEMKENHIRQLVEYGHTMPIHREIKRHMMKWMPGMPSRYVEAARNAVIKRRSGEQVTEEEIEQVLHDEPPKKKQRVEKQPEETEVEDPDVLVVEYRPGLDSLAHKVFKTEVKMEVHSETEEKEEEQESEEEEDIEVEKVLEKTNIVEALKTLEETSVKQAEAYKILREAVPALEERELVEVMSRLPGAPVNTSDPVREAIKREADITIR